MAIALQLLAGVGFAMALVTVHEHGHRLAARLAGVPASDVRVDLDRRPPAVLLRGPDGWLAPDDAGYVDAFTAHRPSDRAAWWFVLGGLVLETVVTAVAVVLLVAAGLQPVARVLAAASALLFAAYLLGDLALTARRGVPFGDHAAAWSIARARTAIALVVAAAAKALGLLLAV